MTRTECQFSLVRYVPDAVKNEFVNIGVVVRGGGATAVRFTRDWSRVRCMDPDADVAMLESLEEEMRSRLQDGAGNPLEKPLWEMFEDSLSNSVQVSESKGCLATSVAAEVEELLRMYVEPAPKKAASRKAMGRAAIVQQMRGEFERAGVWPMLRKRIAASVYTVPGDPLRLDCGYRPNGVVRMFHAVSLQNDADSAKVLAFSMPALTAGVERVDHAKLQLTAVVEPLRQLEEDGDEAVQLYRFGVDVMEQAGLRVLTANDMERAAQTAREELRV
jgi:O-acetyl-ADP-ribose deacetylase (regulator of RNase III)